MRVARKVLTAICIIAIESSPLLPTTGSSHLSTVCRSRDSLSGPVSAIQHIPRQDPPGTIDGANNPELIPNNVAYQLLFLAVAESENSTDKQKSRARGKIHAAALSGQDEAAFLFHLAKFYTRMSAIASQVEQIYKRNPRPDPSSVDAQQLANLKQQRDRLMMDTVSMLPSVLTADGMTRLQAHLQQAKRGMKVIPDDWMSHKMR